MTISEKGGNRVDTPCLAPESPDSLSTRFDTLGALLRARARDHGDRPVCDFFQDATVLTYGEADQLAAALLVRGVRKGTHVAVMIPNRREFPVVLFALARLGALMVPVNTA